MIASLCIPNLHVRTYTCSGATQRRLRVAGEAERHEGGIDHHALDGGSRWGECKGPNVRKIDSAITLRRDTASCAVGRHRLPVHLDKVAQ